MSWRQKLNRWRAYPREERRLFLEAIVWLGVARSMILALKFARIARVFHLHPGETPETVPEEHTARAEKIGCAVRRAAQRTPWESVCLGQALAGALMLQRRRIPSTLYLGVARGEGLASGIVAHAWLRCGGLVLTGNHALDTYSVIARFSWP